MDALIHILFIGRWTTLGWLGNYGASFDKVHSVNGRYCGLWHIFMRGLATCDSLWQRREGKGQIWSKKYDTFLNGPLAVYLHIGQYGPTIMQAHPLISNSAKAKKH